jgi:hypothetical protein
LKGSVSLSRVHCHGLRRRALKRALHGNFCKGENVRPDDEDPSTTGASSSNVSDQQLHHERCHGGRSATRIISHFLLYNCHFLSMNPSGPIGKT